MSFEPRHPRILILDADEDEASLVESYLRDGLKEPGLTVTRATSASAARTELGKEPPDVLLLDLRLRDEEALSFVASLRESGAGIPTVVLTGRADAETAVQALRVGASDVLVKPSLTPASLAATVRYAIQLEESTKRRAETELALHRAERQAEALVAASLDIVSILDARGVIRFCSPSVTRILGYTPEQVTGRNVLDMIGPADVERVTEAFRHSVANTGSGIGVQYAMRHADGSIRQLESLGTSLLDDPAVRGVVVTSRDVTERHLAEDERRRLEAAVEQSASIVFLTDEKGRITYANPAFTRTYGYTREEAIGVTPRILRSDRHDDSFYRAFWEGLLAGRTFKGEIVNRARDGRLVLVRASVAPVRDRRGVVTGYLAVQDDVTERSLMTERLRMAQKMESVGHLAREVAHELGQVFSGVIEGIEAAAEQLPYGSPAAGLLSGARDAARRGAELGRELLAFGRGQVLEPETVSANALLRDTAARLRELLGAGIAIRLELAQEPEPVRVDRREMTDALVRLASFALESLPPGGTLTLEAGTETAPDTESGPSGSPLPRRWVLLAVKDDGPPMDEETRARLFDPFGSSRSVGRGGGLGLAAPYGTVKQAGGFLIATSEKERGNSFRVLLPPAAAGTAGD